MKKYLTIDEADILINAPKNIEITGDNLQSISNLLSKKPPKKDKIEEIKNLISSTPNDFELGKLIREMYNERKI